MTDSNPLHRTTVTVPDLEHPWYGPCDALMPDGGCAECDKVRKHVWSAWRTQWWKDKTDA